MYTVLIVDDDPSISRSVSIYLQKEGFQVYTAFDGLEALEILSQTPVHLILMDSMMPRLNGIQTTLKIRESRNIPIIILSAKSEDRDKINGLTAGADDYITKPFNPAELVARVHSQLRRYIRLGSIRSESAHNSILNGGLTLDIANKTLTNEGTPVRLTPTEYRIVELLMKHKGRVFSIDEIYEAVWNETSFAAENTVAVHIRRIREKIEINPKEPKYIKVVWGIGYKMEVAS
ncbi:MAG: response regulator transcription factor [Oscillospiraceae bacterium]